MSSSESTHTQTRPSKRGYGGKSAEVLAEERRQRLLASALELFGTVGYAPTTVEKLCRHAKVTTRHFYEHFNDREALLIAVFQDILTHTKQQVWQTMISSNLAIKPRLLQAFNIFLSSHLDDPRRARITTQEILGVSLRAEAQRQQVITEFAQLISQFLANLAGQGKIPNRDYRILGYAIVGAMHELQIAWLHQAVPQERQQLLTELDFWLDVLTQGLTETP